MRSFGWRWVFGALVIVGVLVGCGRVKPSPTPTPVLATDTPTAVPSPTVEQGTLALFVEPRDGVTPILEAIAEAQEEIVFTIYLFTNDEIAQALKDALARGVTVRGMMELNPYGGSSVNVDMFDELVAAGAEIRWGPRTYTYLHEKVLVIDRRKALVMTCNFTASAFTASREYGVVTTYPSHVAEILRVFEADWNREDPGLEQPRLVWSPVNARETLLALIDGANTSLDLEQSSLLDEEVIDHLVDAARRGVRVRFLSTPDYPLEEDWDEPGRDRLRQAGALVRYLDDPEIHAKVIVADGARALVGSINLTANSLDHNRELGIVTDDPGVVGDLLAQIEADWARASEEAFPSEDLPTPEVGYIDHRDARKYFYREVTVELPVLYTYNSGRVIWLMPDEDHEANFKVVIFPSVWSKWPEEPDLYYAGKVIRVTGLIEKYRGWPEIIVNDPAQIEIVGEAEATPVVQRGE